jgi:hypothetical protein
MLRATLAIEVLGSKLRRDDKMNRVIGMVPVRTFIIVVVGVGVLALAGYGAQALLTTGPGFGPAVGAPGAAEASGGAAPALDTPGLERELKELVRGQISAQASAGAAPAVDASGLERDLKEIWRYQISTQTSEDAAPAVDESGLERDLKEVVRDRMAGKSQAQ